MAGVLCSMVGATFTVAAAAQVIRAKRGVTVFGNAQVDTAQSQFGGASLLLDGTGDRVVCNNIPSLGSDLTIELWYRHNAWVGQAHFVDARLLGDGSVTKPVIYRGTNNTIRLFFDNADRISGAFTATSGVWYHIALTRSSNIVKLFVNGTQVGSDWTNSQTWTTSNYILGDAPETGFGINGHIDEFRVSNIARYTANFTAPTAPFVNDSNTLALLHMDGTDASTVFEDDNGVRAQRGITAIGNAQIDNVQSRFGGTSALFDGTGDYLLIPYSSDFTMQSDCTFECWVRPTVDADTIFSTAETGTNKGLWLSTWTSGAIIVGTANTSGANVGASISNSGVLTYNAWNHVALVRSETNLYVYTNGNRVLSITSFTGPNPQTTAQGLEIGRGRSISDGAWNAGGLFEYAGHIDEFRVSNTARYTGATYTQPTAPFVNDTNTLLLLHMNQADGSTVFRDDNSGTVTTEDSYTVPTSEFTSDALTVGLYKFENNGNDSGPNAYNFNNTGGYSSGVKQFGSFSGNLSDSTSDYFSHSTDRYWSPYNGTNLTDWTVEGWFYYTSWTGASQDFNGTPLPNAIWIGDIAGNRLSVLFGFSGATASPAGRLILATSRTGGDPRSITAASTNTYNLNTWYHIALTYNATTGFFKGYINGQKVFTTTTPYSDLLLLPTHLVIGGGNAGNSECYVDEVRISRTIRYGR